MRRALAIAAGLAIASSAATAKSREPWETVECHDLVAKVIDATGAAFLRFPEVGGTVQLSHPAAASFSVSCALLPSMGGDVFLSFDGQFPPGDWFTLAGLAGAVITKAPAGAIAAKTRECQRRALKDEWETGEIDVFGAHLECQAFTRDGGGMSINVSRVIKGE